METHANYARVGFFVLFGLAGFFTAALWLANVSIGKQQTTYDIYFSGSVSGLKKGSLVQYRGVPIGIVEDITIATKTVDQVHVTVKIDSTVPIKQDAVATLESQGLTGVSYIQIRGSTKDSPLLEIQKGKPNRIIRSKVSLIEEVSTSLPILLSEVKSLVREIRAVINEENRHAFSQTLHNIEKITEFINPNKDERTSFIGEMNKTMSSIENTLVEVRKMSQEFKDVLKENRQSIKEFSSIGLNSMNKFLIQGQDALSSLKRVTSSLERSPTRFFYNDPNQGVPTK